MIPEPTPEHSPEEIAMMRAIQSEVAANENHRFVIRLDPLNLLLITKMIQLACRHPKAQAEAQESIATADMFIAEWASQCPETMPNFKKLLTLKENS